MKNKKTLILIFIVIAIILALVGIKIYSNYTETRAEEQRQKEEWEIQLRIRNSQDFIDSNMSEIDRYLYDIREMLEFNIHNCIWKPILEKNQFNYGLKEYTLDEQGSFVDFNTAITRYINSDSFRNGIIDIKNNYGNLSNVIETLKDYQDIITEDYQWKYDFIMGKYKIYSNIYELYINYIEAPTEQDYQEFKSKYDEYVKQYENYGNDNEDYQKYLLHQQYPNLY